MASSKRLALAAFAAPLVSASPLRPRADADWTPTNIWTFPGVPTVSITVPTVFPGRGLIPDPVESVPVIEPTSVPGGPLVPDEPDGDSFGPPVFHTGRAVADAENKADDYPPPTFGFGPPTQPIITPEPLVPGGPLVPDDPGAPPFGAGPLRPGRRDDVDPPPATTTSLGRPAQPTSRPLPYNPGGPMRPGKRAADEVGEVNAVDAVEAAGTTPAPTVGAATACTFTAAAAPPAASPCAWNSVLTVYPSTTTVLRAVDCHGCAHVAVSRGRVYACPDFIVSASTSVTTASTRYQTVCAAAAAAATPAPPSSSDEGDE